jgi:UDP-N-acetylmuramoyl-tripeptide--D-alanyl-D-alanine ligase
LATVAIAFNMNIPTEDIKKGIENYYPDDSTGYGRLAVINQNEIKIINDTYNANPGSVSEMIKLINSFPAEINKHIILGDMLELGENSVQEHKEILELSERTTTNIYTFGGEFAKAEAKYNYSDKSNLLVELMKKLGKGDVVLVKGSRGMKMEELVNMILEKI